MKILWFTNTPCSAVGVLNLGINTGGWLISLEKELKKIDSIDLNICFYYNKKTTSFEHNGTHFYPIFRKKRRFKVLKFWDRLFVNQRCNDEREVKELFAIISDIQPEIIHIHGTEDNFGLIQGKVDIPTVVSIQGILNPYYEKNYSGIPEQVTKRYESVLNKLFLRSTNSQYKIFQQKSERELEIFKHTKFILGRTDWDRRITNLLVPQSSYYISNEILRSSFYQYIWDKTKFSDSIQIVTIIKDSLYKGFETIVDAVVLLQQHSDLKFNWNVIGLKSTSNTVKIVKKWKNVDYSKLNISFHSSLAEQQVIDLLLASDIYCQVSHIENSPNSLAEAMILGMPIIATFAGGTSSMLENNKEGILVQEGEAYSIAGSILELSKNFTMANQYGKCAKERALHTHNGKNIAKRLIDTYSEVISKYK